MSLTFFILFTMNKKPEANLKLLVIYKILLFMTQFLSQEVSDKLDDKNQNQDA